MREKKSREDVRIGRTGIMKKKERKKIIWPQTVKQKTLNFDILFSKVKKRFKNIKRRSVLEDNSRAQHMELIT
jgi:hypothetical protein